MTTHDITPDADSWQWKLIEGMQAENMLTKGNGGIVTVIPTTDGQGFHVEAFNVATELASELQKRLSEGQHEARGGGE